MILRNSLALAIAGPLALAAAALVILPAAPATAQTGMEEVQDEGSAYRAWHQASQAGDNTKAMEAAKAYLAKYPTGQYAQFLTNWLRHREDGRARRGPQGEADSRRDRGRAARSWQGIPRT